MNKGFSLLETLIGVLLFSLVINLGLNMFKIISNFALPAYLAQDILSSYQLQNILMVSKKLVLEDEEYLSFEYFNHERYLKVLPDKLVMGEGTVIYYNQIANGLFELNDQALYFSYQRQEKTYRFLIGQLHE